MKYCQPDLQSRQVLRGLDFQITELRNTLLECSMLDIPLLSNKHFYSAMEALLEASGNINQLRGAASPLFMSDLEKDRKEVSV